MSCKTTGCADLTVQGLTASLLSLLSSGQVSIVWLTLAVSTPDGSKSLTNLLNPCITNNRFSCQMVLGRHVCTKSKFQQRERNSLAQLRNNTLQQHTSGSEKLEKQYGREISELDIVSFLQAALPLIMAGQNRTMNHWSQYWFTHKKRGRVTRKYNGFFEIKNSSKMKWNGVDW